MSSFSSKCGSFQLRILEVLREEAMHGYAIMNELERRDGKRPTTAALYPALKKLEKYGLIESKIESGEKRERKIYNLTKKGLDELANVYKLMVVSCLTKLQEEVKVIEEEIFNRLEVQNGFNILYPSPIYKSIHDLALKFNGKAKIHALVPSKTIKDPIEKALNHDRLSHIITVKEGWLEHLPFNDATVDVALYPLTLCRCSPWATPIHNERAVKEVARILKPNAKFVLLDFEKSDHAMLRVISESTKMCGFTCSEAKKLLEGCGFKEVSTNSQNGILIIEGICM